MNELRLSPKLQAWLDLMPGEAPDRLMDAVISEVAEVRQVRSRFGALRLVVQRPRTLAVLVVAALLLALVAFLIGAGLPKVGPHVYLNQVVPAQPLVAARAHPVVAALADGRALVVGGSDTAPVAEIVDPTTGTRIPIDGPPGGQALRHAYAGARLPDGRVFLLTPGEAWAFDPRSASLAPLAGMTAARDEAAIVVLQEAVSSSRAGTHLAT
jgi:hypothetical protein